MGFFSDVKKIWNAKPSVSSADETAGQDAAQAAPANDAGQMEPEYAVVPQGIRDFILKHRGVKMPEKVLVSEVFPLTHARREKERREQEELLKNPQPGQKMPDGTIYVGQYKPKDRDGQSLAKTFNVFAAPEDLPETMQYYDAVKHIAGLKKWHGYDGTNYATDKELYAAIKSGSYNGGWIIPTRDILHGKDVDGKDTTPDNILAHKDKGAFKEAKHAFKMAASSGYDYPNWYWSSTEDRDNPSALWFVRLPGDYVDWGFKDYYCLSCRPVRLVEVTSGGGGARP